MVVDRVSRDVDVAFMFNAGGGLSLDLGGEVVGVGWWVGGDIVAR